MCALQVGLPGYSRMPTALAAMPRQDRATYCNDHWEEEWKKVFTLEFSRRGWGAACVRKSMAGNAAGGFGHHPMHVMLSSSPLGPQPCRACKHDREQHAVRSGQHLPLGLLWPHTSTPPPTPLPFRRDRKMMSVLCAANGGSGPRMLWVKGAPENVLARCSGALSNEGAVEPLSQGLRSALLGKVGVLCVLWYDGRSQRVLHVRSQAGLQRRKLPLSASHRINTQTSSPPPPLLRIREHSGGSRCECWRRHLIRSPIHLSSLPSLPISPPRQVSEYGAGAALRVLALAYRPWPLGRREVAAEDEQGLTFIGLVGMQVHMSRVGKRHAGGLWAGRSQLTASLCPCPAPSSLLCGGTSTPPRLHPPWQALRTPALHPTHPLLCRIRPASRLPPPSSSAARPAFGW